MHLTYDQVMGAKVVSEMPGPDSELGIYHVSWPGTSGPIYGGHWLVTRTWTGARAVVAVTPPYRWYERTYNG